MILSEINIIDSEKGFNFERNNQIFNLPTIDCYKFKKKELQTIDNKKYIPAVLDINIPSPCNIMCKYCFTSHGKDDRFGVDINIPKITQNETKEIIKQFGELGGKVIFLCSEGEPLFYPKTFIDYVKMARNSNLEVITYTNTTKITKELAKSLHELEVNLVLKLESLNPKHNDYLLNSRGKYLYDNFLNHRIPTSIINVLEEYEKDKEKLAFSSMLTKYNKDDVLELRKWIFEQLEMNHFVKQLYIYGQAEKNMNELVFEPDEFKTAVKNIYDYDETQGYFYPMDVQDTYSYEIRRFLNNTLNSEGFPLRVFGHPRGGVFHNSNVLDVNFGFPDGKIVTMRDERNKINIQKYFKTIYQNIISEHK